MSYSNDTLTRFTIFNASRMACLKCNEILFAASVVSVGLILLLAVYALLTVFETHVLFADRKQKSGVADISSTDTTGVDDGLLTPPS